MTIDGTLTFLRRWAALALFSAVLLWGGLTYRCVELYIDNNGDPKRIIWFMDHMAFYTGARFTLFGAEDKLYDYPFTTTYQNQMFAKDPSDHSKDAWTWLLAFRNPPFYAMLYWPTCEWPFMWSALAWACISMIVTIVSVWWMTDDDRFGRRLAWTLSFYPVLAAIDYGQNTPLSFGIFAGSYALMAKRRLFLAGLVAGLLWYKPQLMLGLGLWALLDIRRLWPCALGVIITGILLASVNVIVLPTATQGFRDSFDNNLKFDSFEQFKMHNPLAMIRLLLPADRIAAELEGPAPPGEDERTSMLPYYRTLRAVRFVHNVFALLCALAAVALFYKLWKHRRNDVNVMFGAAVFLTIWAGPHALIYEWMLLAITGLLWVREWGDRPNTWFALYACAWGVLYFSTDLNSWILGHSPVTLQWSVPVLAGVGWYGVNLLTKPQTQRATG